MGASESFPVTPTCTPLLNKHLKNVRDPRSPTAGILRTPIEVESSPKDNRQFPKQGELVAKSQHENWDPRSPTPGISRTPLKDVLADAINYPVKLFCENFMGENSEEELPQDESQHQDQKSEFTFGVEERTARSTVSSGEIFLEDSQQAEGENEQLFSMVSVAAATKPVQSARIIHPTGIKSVKRRVSNKMLGMPTGTGRSPLGILHGDNSPISLASHQASVYDDEMMADEILLKCCYNFKSTTTMTWENTRTKLNAIHSKRSSSVTDNQRETKDGTLSLSFGTNFPADSCGWDLMNKENRQCRWVEN